MKLKINGAVFEKWANLSVSLLYASVASTFSFDIYFDPWDSVHREIMLPGAYNEAEVIADSGEVLITGVLLSPSFKSSAVRSLVNVSGYSKTGVLMNVKYAAIVDTTQSDNDSLAAIARRVCDAFGLQLNPNSNVPAAALGPITHLDTNNRGVTCAEYLAEIAKDLNIVLTHDAYGNLILTQAVETKPVFDFEAGMPGVQFELQFDGQDMHHEIRAETQGGGGQTTQPVKNPYVQHRQGLNYMAIAFNSTVGQQIKNEGYSTGNRPGLVQQTSGNDNGIVNVAKQALAEELRAIRFMIMMVGWELNGRVVRTADEITALVPECYLFVKTKFFIEQVDFSGEAQVETCVIHCVVPEVYNGKDPVNIFTAKNNDTTMVGMPVDEVSTDVVIDL